MELGYTAVSMDAVELGFCMVLTGIRDLEENVLHNVAAISSLELKRLTAKVDVLEAPGGSRMDSGQALLTLHDLQHEVYSCLTSITGSPGLARHGVGRVPVGSHRLAIDEGLRDSITCLRLTESHHLGHDGSRGKLNQDNVVQADLVE